MQTIDVSVWEIRKVTLGSGHRSLRLVTSSGDEVTLHVPLDIGQEERQPGRTHWWWTLALAILEAAAVDGGHPEQSVEVSLRGTLSERALQTLGALNAELLLSRQTE